MDKLLLHTDTCPNCGESLIGDGYKVILHCPNAEDESWWYSEPDANPVFCSCNEGE